MYDIEKGKQYSDSIFMMISLKKRLPKRIPTFLPQWKSFKRLACYWVRSPDIAATSCISNCMLHFCRWSVDFNCDTWRLLSSERSCRCTCFILSESTPEGCKQFTRSELLQTYNRSSLDLQDDVRYSNNWSLIETCIFEVGYLILKIILTFISSVYIARSSGFYLQNPKIHRRDNWWTH